MSGIDLPEFDREQFAEIHAYGKPNGSGAHTIGFKNKEGEEVTFDGTQMFEILIRWNFYEHLCQHVYELNQKLKKARTSAIKECAEIAEKAVDAHKKGYEETTQPASLKNQFRTKQFAVDTVLQEILSLIEAEEGK